MAVVSANLSLFCSRNYVVQYILDLKNSLAIGNLASQFEGKYVQLSIQKFSSNVVEKCLKILGEDDRATIILELISVSHFEQLLQDPYANYVIKSALLNSKVPISNQFSNNWFIPSLIVSYIYRCRALSVLH